MRVGLLAVVLVCLMLTVGPVQAMPLGLVHSNPDLYAENITLSYDKDTDVFTASGFTRRYTVPPSYDIDFTQVRTWTLNAIIDGTGKATSGNITIMGTILDGDPTHTGTLLTGTLQSFGFVPDGSPGDPYFEFLFASSGGALTSDFGGAGNLFAVAISGGIDLGSPFQGDFQTSFEYVAMQSDTFYQPEPATLSLLAAGALGLLARRRRSKKVSH